MNKPRKYKNLLALEIGTSTNMLSVYLSGMTVISRAMFRSIVVPSVVYKMWKAYGVNSLLSKDEKIIALFIKSVKDSNKLLADYQKEQKNSSDISADPIERTEVVNSTYDLINAMDAVKDAVTYKKKIYKLNDIVPQDFIGTSSSPTGRIREYIESTIQERLDNLNKTVPKYIYELKAEYWEIRFGGESKMFKDSKGLYYIYTLLNNPQKAIRADVLKNLDSGSVDMPENIDNEKHSNNTEEKANPKKYYEGKSKAELKEDVETLEHFRDQETLNSNYHKKLDDEIDALKKYIRRNFNLFGKPRPTDLGEKARQAVLKAIMRDTKRVKRDLPELYQHLDRHITTGYECIYNPPNEEIKSWQFKA